MNCLKPDSKKNRILFREIFLKVNDDLLKRLNKLKTNYYCHRNKKCCKIRYLTISPQKINELNIQNEELAEDYVELFIPYGAGDDFDYKNNNFIDINKNHEEAKKVDNAYATKILNKLGEDLYFYYCKCADDEKCIKSSVLCNYPTSVTSVLPDGCTYANWQKQCLQEINDNIQQEILMKLQEIEENRLANYSCKCTGSCCKLASSEFSYEELKQKATAGDEFATQFTSVFIPYKDAEKVNEIFSEYIEYVREKLDDDEEIYFYHCPHITEENLCSRYEERPQICKDFPNNPLSILPKQCGFYEWKEEVYVVALILYALIQLSEFYLEKIDLAIQ